ncbi:uncharacterized protein LOC144650242 isoform X1 [Oculina patagonica]
MLGCPKCRTMQYLDARKATVSEEDTNPKGTKQLQSTGTCMCCACQKLSAHTRGHVSGTCPATFPRMCAHCDFVAATCPRSMSPQCEQHMILLLLHVAATCPCDMSPRVQRP